MKLCGIDINCPILADLLGQDKACMVVTVNAEAIVRSQHDDRLREIINHSVTTIDGQMPLWLYKLAHPQEKIEKISGSDLIYILAEWAQKKRKRIFLLGGKESSNMQAVEKLRATYEGLQVSGFSPEWHPYPFPESTDSDILSRIASDKPHILFVGFGMGKQEFWEYDHLELLKSEGIEMIIGCGGTFEFVSGQIKRAPKLIQNMGLEGFYRLGQEFKWFRIKRLLLSFKIFYYFVKFHIFKSVSTSKY